MLQDWQPTNQSEVDQEFCKSRGCKVAGTHEKYQPNINLTFLPMIQLN